MSSALFLLMKSTQTLDVITREATEYIELFQNLACGESYNLEGHVVIVFDGTNILLVADLGNFTFRPGEAHFLIGNPAVHPDLSLSSAKVPAYTTETFLKTPM